MQWYERARDRASQLKLSHESIAERIGRGRSTVSGWMSGDREPKLEEISMLSKVLGVPAQWLFFGDINDYNSVPKSTYSDEIQIPIWNINGKTNKLVTVPSDVSIHAKAYIIQKDSGCGIAPAGTLLVIDHNIKPETKDYVFAEVNAEFSLFHFLEAAGKCFLSVDDHRLPLIEINEDVKIMGVLVFLSRKLKY